MSSKAVWASPDFGNPISMTGKTLEVALERTLRTRTQTVTFVSDSMLQISIALAVQMAKSGRYEGMGTKHRVSAIRLKPKPAPKHQICWRTSESSVCPPPYGYQGKMLTRGGCPR